ncbi:hypothetical protein FQV39_04545 [Bosea sp. F3-2]|uniref:hypothetical protein n=1 Tax=Bosea sp. F3-2 TaxID=2599640 RepID=UPI0011EDBF2B|nr:hypothetical protein [Bosea sp. F3-2]QEL21929.1 hypothetical protein FQV39_04545 [Bosea sp. F3-2]
MTIADLTAKELGNLEANYVRLGKTTGGKYSLHEVRLEKLRRQPNPFGTRESFIKIIELAKVSTDAKLTYGDLWSAFRPNEKWKGQGTATIVKQALGRVAAYCVDHGLPIVTVLVVHSANRELSAKAKENIFNAARDLGVDVGANPEAFVERQIVGAMKISTDDLPAPEPSA